MTRTLALILALLFASLLAGCTDYEPSPRGPSEPAAPRTGSITIETITNMDKDTTYSIEVLTLRPGAPPSNLGPGDYYDRAWGTVSYGVSRQLGPHTLDCQDDMREARFVLEGIGGGDWDQRCNEASIDITIRDGGDDIRIQRR